MTRLLWCGGIVVEAAAAITSLPGSGESYCWITAGMLSALPFGYGIAAAMLNTLSETR